MLNGVSPHQIKEAEWGGRGLAGSDSEVAAAQPGIDQLRMALAEVVEHLQEQMKAVEGSFGPSGKKE